MTTPTPPPEDKPSPMLGLQPLADAAKSLEHSSAVIKDTANKTNTQLAALDKTLKQLASVLGKSGTAAKTGNGGSSGSGHSYGQNGGTQPAATPSTPGTPAQKPPNGGFQSALNNIFGKDKAPTPYAPAPASRFAQTFATGSTPKSWNTKYNQLEMGAQVTRDVMGKVANRGLSQLDDQSLLQQSTILSTSRNGGDLRAVDSRGVFNSALGSTRNTPNSFSQTSTIGANGRSSVQNAQDATAGQDIAERFSGGNRTANQQKRFDSMYRAADAFAYANPTMSFSDSQQIVGNLIKPSTLMTMRFAGLPDPRDSSGAYKGNSAFFAAFLKKIYQGRASVPEDVFDDDFAETGVGWADLVAIVGEDGAEAMREPLRAFNRVKTKGGDTSDFDKVLSESNLNSDKYDPSRKTAQDKYTIGRTDDSVSEGKRANSKSLASQVVGNEKFMQVQTASTGAMNVLAEALQLFVNSPVVSDIAQWVKGMGPTMAKVVDMAGQGALSFNGATSLSGNGPGDGGGGKGYGGAPVTPTGGSGGGSAGPDKPKGAKEKLAALAASYAKGSRKYKYSMKYRNKDGYFDCSSFVSRTYAQMGYKVGPTTVQMWRQGEHVDFKDLQPGDILLHADGRPGAASGAAEHTAMYIGDGKIVGTSSRGKNGNTIQVQPVYGLGGYWDDARRIIGAKNTKRGKAQKDPASKGGPSTPDSSDPTSLSPADDTDSSGSGGGSVGGMLASLGGGSGGGSSIGGLGAPNPAAYSYDEMGALASILGGGGGGAPAPDTGESSDTPPPDADGSQQDPGGDPAQATPSKQTKPTKTGNTPKDSKASKTPTKQPKNTSPAANRALGRSMMSAKGWGKQWSALERLWTRESGWNELAENKSSGAYGIPQSLPGTKMASAGRDWRTNPATQIKWGLSYIASRYGNPTKAWAHSQSTGWYADGAWQVPDDQVAVVHKNEMIMPSKQAQTIRDALIKENIGGGATATQDGSSKGSSGNVELHFGAGSVVLSFAEGASRQAGAAAAQGFLKELERKDLYKKISRAGVLSDNP